MKKKLTVVYDGECPLCRTYVKLINPDDSIGSVDLVDARHPGVVRQELTRRGFDLDQGMVVITDEQVYFGGAAVSQLSRVGRRNHWLNRFFFLLFRSELSSSFFYPVLRGFRNLALWIANVPQINNLQKDKTDA